jgi:hypothetical protein
MWPLLFLLLISIYSAAARQQVEVRADEVWIITDGQARQLTSDGKSKLQAVLSPSANRIAYYEQCSQSEHCLPSIVILDLEGKRLKAFHPMTQAVSDGEPCGSILNIIWLSETVIAAECHLNPSLSEYVETDLGTQKTISDLLGYGFTPSPDRKYVAHVGPIVHFASPMDRSNYLHIDKTTVYPLPKRARPAEKDRDVVRQRGWTWIGVLEFFPRFSWSPDSERIAFIDCLFDWIASGVDDGGGTFIGNETNRRCFVAVVARTGKFVLFPIGGPPVVATDAVSFSWNSPNQLSVEIRGTAREFKIP